MADTRTNHFESGAREIQYGFGDPQKSNVMASYDIVIVNWNAGQLLVECLDSIERWRTEGLGQVVVVDNASDAFDPGMLAKSSFPMQVICNRENIGFARACNQGAATCSARYLLFLNPDTTVRHETFAMPIKFMDSMAANRVGICGVQMTDRNGRHVISGANFPRLGIFLKRCFGLREPAPKAVPIAGLVDGLEAVKVDQVIGAFFLVRTALFRELNGFDERFFVYFEEVDFAYRARLAGWSSAILRNATCYHYQGGCSQWATGARLYYSLNSRLTYARKHFSRLDFFLLVLLTIMIEWPARLARGAIKSGWQEVRRVTSAYLRLFRALPGIRQVDRHVVIVRQESP